MRDSGCCGHLRSCPQQAGNRAGGCGFRPHGFVQKGFSIMRRHDREITDPEKINRIISACRCCRLGLCDGGRPYVVPLNFGHTVENGRHVFYFHGAAEGRKVTLLRRTGWAGFELDTGYRLHPAGTACGHSAAFQSVIGGGRVTFLEEPEAKRRALNCIMAHNTGREDWDFSEEAVRAVCVYRLEAEELSCKEHL